MTPAQHDQLERARVADLAAHNRALERARYAARRHKLERQQAEADLAEELLPHIAHESTIDPLEHALAIAKTILERRGTHR